MKIIFVIGFILAITTVTAQRKRDYPRVEINELATTSFDTVEVIASVKSVYKCPPCPEGAQCKTCIGDHVEVISGEQAQWTRLFTHEPDKYIVHKAYVFVVRFRSKLHRTDNVEIVSARLL